MPTVKLQSSDGEVFEVDVEVAKKSETLKTMLESIGDDNEDEVVPITKVRAYILEKVIEWSEYHLNDVTRVECIPDDKYHEYPISAEDICDWDKEFMDVEMTTKFELILAANFLEIKDLLDLACKSVAIQIKGKSPEEMRQIFNLPNSRKVLQNIFSS